MEIIIALLEIVFEFLFQIIFELIAEMLGYHFKKSFREQRPIPRPLSAISHLIVGALAGLISLWIIPELMIRTPALQIANLIFTPLAAGLVMALWARWRSAKKTIDFAPFSYGFLFAFTMACVRFYWGGSA